jgi:hypothetical protein
MSEIPIEGPEVPLDQVQALSALEKALGEALSQVPREEVLSRVIAMFPSTPVEIDRDQLSRFHGRVQKVSVSMPEDLATAIREHTGPGGFSRFVAEAAERQLKSEQFRELLDELDAEGGPIPPELDEQVMREWLAFYEED